MKKILFSLIAAVSINASAAQYVTVVVCDPDHAQVCRKVSYKVRPASPQSPAVVLCPIGDGGAEGPCPTKFGVPAWLKALNEMFPNGTPVEQDIYRGN